MRIYLKCTGAIMKTYVTCNLQWTAFYTVLLEIFSAPYDFMLVVYRHLNFKVLPLTGQVFPKL